ncbi:MAG: AAA family ATPase, partial [Clostridia bacterium]|nr:AAA family ATPase [Clostridia bacterium]
MLLGRNEQLQMLEDMAASDKSTFTILYGRTGIGKTTLLKKFASGKNAVCYCAPQASLKEQLAIMKEQFKVQLGSDASEAVGNAQSYNELFALLAGKDLLIIEEFQNIVKADKEFI